MKLLYNGKYIYKYNNKKEKHDKKFMDKNENIRNEITEIEIEDGVKTIPDNAFELYPNVTSIIIPDSVTEIGVRAFKNCFALNNVILPNSIKEINESTFYNCESLNSIKLSDNITKIEDKAFTGCTSLKSITIPEKVTEIGSEVFCDTSLEEIKVDDKNIKYTSKGENIECNAIIDKTTNTLVVGCINTIIPDGITKIGNDAFSLTNVKEIHLPDSVTEIGEDAFSGCEELESINLHDNITSIGPYAFLWCKSLKEIHMPKNLTKIEKGLFDACFSLEAINLPEGITEIGDSAFEDCKFKKIAIPKKCKKICNRAFTNCKFLESISLPDDITLELFAFMDCDLTKCKNIPEVIKENIKKLQQEKNKVKVLDYLYSKGYVDEQNNADEKTINEIIANIAIQNPELSKDANNYLQQLEGTKTNIDLDNEERV